MKDCETPPTKANSLESLQEKCWQETYKGESRKWLIRDASGKFPRGPLSSTMKETYVCPSKEDSDGKNMGETKLGKFAAFKKNLQANARSTF